MEHNAATSEPAPRYLYRHWRYSKLVDALAVARRDASPGSRKEG